ncbi:unannotated protein [freshwater metagenome]|uniref:Unannotated protein n=1 Tax=freshwater metagenome TaxID=449393 RepID=A0A6J7SBS4_9ZZZZ
MTTLAVVAHLVDVRTARCIWFGGHLATVGELRHAHNIGNHDPFGTIHKIGPHPVGELLWIDASNETQIADNHESLNVMRVRVRIDLGHNLRDTLHLRLRFTSKQRG